MKSLLGAERQMKVNDDIEGFAAVLITSENGRYRGKT